MKTHPTTFRCQTSNQATQLLFAACIVLAATWLGSGCISKPASKSEDIQASSSSSQPAPLPSPVMANGSTSSGAHGTLTAGCVVIPIYYATDRKPVMPLNTWRNLLRDNGSELEYYGSEFSDSVEFGVCPISIPTNTHRIGKIERPPWPLKTEALEKHFMIVTLTPLGERDFVGRINSQLTQTGRGDAFVFIHGYNVSFSAAAMRTAQLTYDWGFPGAAILYSWPSDGAVLTYDKDQETADLTRNHLFRFLRDVVVKTKATNIHLVAHSMGNRVLTGALKEFLTAPDSQGGPPYFFVRILRR